MKLGVSILAPPLGFIGLQGTNSHGRPRQPRPITTPAQPVRRIIASFGRHPHRNAILGRTSTPDESAYLLENPGW